MLQVDAAWCALAMFQQLEFDDVGLFAVGVGAVHEAHGHVAEVGADEEELVGVARPLHELDDRLVELARHADGEGGERALDDEERVDLLGLGARVRLGLG